VVIESWVKHDHHTLELVFCFFVFFFAFVCFTQKWHRNDNGALKESISHRSIQLIYKYKHEFFSWFLRGREIEEETFLLIYIFIKKKKVNGGEHLLCVRNKLGNRWRSSTELYTCENLLPSFHTPPHCRKRCGIFFFLRFSKLTKKKGRGREGEVTRIRHATLNLPSSRFLLLRLSP
jgi:hypothetical protein